jgi:indole-3-glycerol phosphate synthase
MTILDEIFAYKRKEVSERKAQFPLSRLQEKAADATPGLDFLHTLRASPSKPALIAEVKKGSPSKGVIAADLDPIEMARIYQQNGASAISVLTDRQYFMGDLAYLARIRKELPATPLLRKDFIFDPYQMYESRAAGADAVLLIVAGLDGTRLNDLLHLCQQLGMTALVEVHTLRELEVALNLRPKLIGINNRNLHDFSVDLKTTQRLRSQIPLDVCVVAESGIHSPEDVRQLAQAGADAILVGEALVSATNIPAQVRSLAGVASDEG